MSSSVSGTSVNKIAVFVALAAATAFAAAAGWFALNQAVWVDEATQLFGLSLPTSEQLQWLTGASSPPSGVPADRSPPLSYLIGSLWAAIAGPGEMPMRIAGILAFLAGAPAIWMAGQRLGSWAGATFALGLVLLSPGMIVQAVEIRPYPFFFAFSCWALWAYVEILARPALSIRHLIILSALLLLAIYTHFYGVVFAFCLLGSLFVFSLLARRPIVPVIVAGVTVVVLSAGILPFLPGGMGSGTGGGKSLVVIALDTARLAYRLVFHGAHLSLGMVMVGLAAAALAVLALLTIIARWRSPLLFALGPLVLAFMVLPTASLLVSDFDALSPKYSLWMVPNAAIFLAGAFAFRRQIVAWTAAAVVLLAHLAADVILLANPEPWTHGPAEWIVEQITDPAQTLIIHDGTSEDWDHAAYPVFYLTRGAVTQIYRDEDGDQLVTGSGLEPLPDGFSEGTFDRIMLLRLEPMTSETLAARDATGEDCGFDAPAPGSDEPDRAWESHHRCSFLGAAMAVGDRASP